MTATLIPIFTSQGEAEAFLAYPYLFNRNGEWIGFLTPQREVYSVLGYHVGQLTSDPRIVRKRSGESLPRVKPPQAPGKIRIPAMTPLPKLMGDLSHENVDVLQDESDRLHTLDSGEMRQDLD